MLKELAIYNPSTEELICIALAVFVIFAAGWFLGLMHKLDEFDEQQTTFPGALSEKEAWERARWGDK